MLLHGFIDTRHPHLIWMAWSESPFAGSDLLSFSFLVFFVFLCLFVCCCFFRPCICLTLNQSRWSCEKNSFYAHLRKFYAMKCVVIIAVTLLKSQYCDIKIARLVIADRLLCSVV